ncbi:MAG: tetratricopeptide repeat protein [Planctomycetota bacterium]|nr:tetratricopeptide repeat protein [Planctomycetota bacterium]
MSERCQGDAPAKARGGTKSDARSDRSAVELPIHPSSEPRGRAAIRKSRVGPWRAAVLILVHVLIAAHFVHWWTTGRTLSPFEPSESMEFSTTGIVNVGFVLFVVAIASTAILGRWFCGWACHIVALQDFCRWLLGKIGLVPRLVDMGPLRVVPWLAFVYMFLAPLFDRALAGQSLHVTGAHFMTEDLWRTFPKTWGEGLVTLAVCGFVIVWLLGSKGFCTYGCPYGGIFGVVDQVAPARIRVTDACEGCGHCTAVCTSNVNVAREVREFGMVVDPGCMKCLDCVSVCPNDALYVGFGKPALLATAKSKPEKPSKPAFDWARLALSAGFAFATLAIFLWHDGIWNLRFTAITWAFSFAVILVFRGKSRPKADHTILEEVGMAVLFLVAMACFRGLQESVSFLFALGISAILAWWGIELVRLMWAPDVRVQKTPLKRAGRWTLAGGVFAATALPIGWISYTGLREQLAEQTARAASKAEAEGRRELAVKDYNLGVEAAQRGRVEEAIAAFQRAVETDPAFLPARENLAGALCMSGRLAEGLAQFEIAIAQNPGDAGTLALAGQALAALNRLPEARARVERAVELAPTRFDLWRMLADLQDATGDPAGARESRARADAAERGAPR